MNKKSLFVIVVCVLIVLSSIIAGIVYSLNKDKIVLTFSSTLTNSHEKIEIDKGSTLSMNNYSRTAEGYEFLGWYNSPALEEKVDDDYIFTTNKTLYAGFSKIINVNQIDNLTDSNMKSYTIVSSNASEVVDSKHIKKLLTLGVTRIDLSKANLKNQQTTSDMFSNSNIREVVLGISTLAIGSYTFENCYNLNNIILSTSISNIEAGAFKNCRNLSSINLLEGVLEIQEDAFYGCNNLTEIYIPSTVNNIYNNFISNSNKLRNISVSENNENYISVDGILYSKDFKRLIKCPQTKSGEIIVPSDVEVIEDYAFHKCNISKVTFSTNLKEIKSYAFYQNENLKNIQIASTNNYLLENSAFENCSKLETIKFGAGIESIGESCFRNNYSLTTVEILENNCFENVGDSAFTDCVKLKEITLPDSVNKIGVNVFYNCKSLENVSVGNGVHELPNRLFYNCENLKKVELKYSVTQVGTATFFNCKSLEEIIGIDYLQSAGDSCFYNCEKLQTLSVDNLKNISDYMFYNCKSLEKLTVLEVKSIGTYSFYGCSSLKKINLGSALRSIEESSFYEVRELSINIIGNSNFVVIDTLVLSSDYSTLYFVNSEESIHEITIPKETEIIYNSAISGKKYLETINVDTANTKFSSSDGILLSYNKNILYAYPSGRTSSTVVIPDSVKYIKEYSIESEYVTEITVHENVISIENNSLSYVPNLQTLTIPFVGTGKENTSQKWISAIFGAGKNETQSNGINNGYYLPQSLKTINITNETNVDPFAFYNAYNVEKITLNKNVRSISDYSFAGCTNLKEVVFNGELLSIGAYAFENCKSVREITLGYNAGLIINNTALSSLGKSIEIYVSYDSALIVDNSARKTYKNKFFAVSANSRQWKWYFNTVVGE